MEKSIFDFAHYKSFLHHKVGSKSERKGLKLALARHLGCQPTYVSQVLNGSADFSLEQAEKLNNYFGHSPDEAHYFLLLLQKDRAGSKNLRSYFQSQIDELLERRLVLTKRLGQSNKLNEEQRAVYYSSWHFAAIHIALTIPELRSRDAIAEYLNLPARRVTEALEFLLSCGLCTLSNHKYVPGDSEIRLGKDSHNIVKHHSNWRSQALEALDREELGDLHYSSVISLSQADALKIKDAILESIRENLTRVKSSREEVLYSYCVDFFSMKRNTGLNL